MAQLNSVCADGSPLLTPDTSCHEGCPVLTKVRHIVVPKGICPTIEWPLRAANGKAINLSLCFPVDADEESESSESSTSVSLSVPVPAGTTFAVRARFAECDNRGTIYERPGAVADAASGKVRFTLPKEVFDEAGINVMSVAIVSVDAEGVELPVFAERGLLSMEDSLWGNTGNRQSPPTLADIRMHLRDTGVENDFLQDVEFDADELVSALVQPIQYWNEVPPPIAYLTCRTFPFKYHWMRATVSELLKTAAHHYMRNNVNVDHGGVRGNFKDRFKEYLAVAKMYEEEWKVFVDEKKVSINAAGGRLNIGSPYDNTALF